MVPNESAPAGTIRPDFLAKDVYISSEVVQLEREKLWPRVWQVACREEELKAVGDFVTYDVAGQSIIVVRAREGHLKAFHNTCQHRGRRLVTGAGRTAKFHCKFHGWQYEWNGAISRIIDREDWDGCSEFADQNLSLKQVQVDTRAGFVFSKEPDRTLKAMFSERSTHATTRILQELPPTTAPFEVLMKATEFQKEAAIASGAGWPDMNFEQMGRAGADWHVFPNLVFLPTADAALFYRARPNGNDPDSCIFDIWSLVRYPPGAEPTGITHESAAGIRANELPSRALRVHL